MNQLFYDENSSNALSKARKSTVDEKGCNVVLCAVLY